MEKNTENPEITDNVKTFNDPGNVLIVGYIIFIILLLLLGNLANASFEDSMGKNDAFIEDMRQSDKLLKNILN